MPALMLGALELSMRAPESGPEAEAGGCGSVDGSPAVEGNKRGGCISTSEPGGATLPGSSCVRAAIAAGALDARGGSGGWPFGWLIGCGIGWGIGWFMTWLIGRLAPARGGCGTSSGGGGGSFVTTRNGSEKTTSLG